MNMNIAVDREISRLLQENRKDVQKYNAASLVNMQRIASFCLLMAILIGVFVESFSKCVPGYTVTLVIFFCLAEFFRMKRMQPYTLLGIYMSLMILNGLVFYLSFYMFPERPTAVACLFFCVMPMLIMDKPIRYYSSVGTLYLLYAVLSIQIKGTEIGAIDAVNAFISLCIGLWLGKLFMEARLGFFEAQRLLAREKTTDVLTGVGNRRKLYEKLGEIYSDSEIRPACVLMMDIDYFKRFNDTYGHAAGDACLRGFGSVLLSIREIYKAAVYRYGGEEFVALLWDCKQEKMYQIAEVIRQEAEKLSIDGKHMTVSIGAVYCSDSSILNYETWIDYADQALYAAKKSGRNKTVCWDHSFKAEKNKGDKE